MCAKAVAAAAAEAAEAASKASLAAMDAVRDAVLEARRIVLVVSTNGWKEEWDRDGGVGGKAADAVGIGEGSEEKGVPVEGAMMASEGGEGNGRRQGMIGLVGSNGVVRHKGMARRSILLGKADPAAAVSCTRMRGPSRRDMASTLRVTFICGNGFCMLFCEGLLTTHQHANGHTKHKTFTPRTHHTRFIQMLADV